MMGGIDPRADLLPLGGKDDFVAASVAACLRTPHAIRWKSRGNDVYLNA